MKTGTTYLQRLLTANREVLLGSGVLFPTAGGRWALQSDAVRDRAGSAVPDLGRDVAGAWDRLMVPIREHPDSSVVSMEFMSFVDAAGARSFVEGLPPAEIHVILTVRDAALVVPAIWQTGARNRGVRTWSRFVDELTANPPDPQSPAWRRFQRTQGIPRMLAAWTASVPAERVHVVTVPPRGSRPELLWERFAEVVGLDPGMSIQQPTRLNESLGHPSAELVRRVNNQLGKELRGAIRTSSKQVLSMEVLASRRSSERPVHGGARVARFGSEWNRGVLAAVDELGVNLIGERSDLPHGVPPESLAQGEPSEPTTAELIDAAAFAVVELSRRIPGRQAVEGASRVRWEAAPHPVRAAVREVVAVVRAHAAANS